MTRSSSAIAVLWLAGAGLWVFLAHPALSPDSIVYIAAAMSLSESGTLTLPFAVSMAAGLPIPYAAWPPGYPAFIAALAQTGLAHEGAARLLGVVGLLCGLALFIRLCSPGKARYYSFYLVTLCSTTAVISVSAWSEGLFFAATMGSALAMFSWLENDHGRSRYLWIAASLAAAAMQLRYAGIFLIPALIWLTWQRGSRTQRIAGTVLHLSTVLPLLFWFMRNDAMASGWRGGTLTSTAWWRAPAELSHAVAQLAGVALTGSTAADAVAGALILGGFGLLVTRSTRRALKTPSVQVSIAFLFAIVAGTVVARALGHLWILDARILWPAWAFMSIVAIHLARNWFDQNRRTALVLLLFYTVLQSVMLMQTLASSGPNQRSGTPLVVPTSIDSEEPILCNRGWTVWHDTGLRAYYLPFAYYGDRILSPDSLSEWAARRGVRHALWIDESRSEQELLETYGALGPLMATADSAYFSVIKRQDGITWMQIRP